MPNAIIAKYKNQVHKTQPARKIPTEKPETPLVNKLLDRLQETIKRCAGNCMPRPDCDRSNARNDVEKMAVDRRNPAVNSMLDRLQ